MNELDIILLPEECVLRDLDTDHWEDLSTVKLALKHKRIRDHLVKRRWALWKPELDVVICVLDELGFNIDAASHSGSLYIVHSIEERRK